MKTTRSLCLAVLALLFAFAVDAIAVPGGPAADYQFQNTYASSVGGAPALTDLIKPGEVCPKYCNGFGTDTVNSTGETVLFFQEDNGVALQPTTSILTNNGIYSIAIIARFDDTGGYKRLVEFKNGGADTGLYLLDGRLNFYNYVVGPDTVAANTYFSAVLTRDAAGTLTGYLNGVQQFSVSDSANQYGVIDANNVLRFFQDNLSGANDEASSGSVARIRVWNRVLTPQEVAALTPFAYVRSAADGPPWDVTTNEDAMNGVFGMTNWEDLRFESVDPNYLFSSTRQFVFLEGGDDDTPDLVTFLNNNLSLIMSWVDGGGRLFVNAAPNSGPSTFSMGFDVMNNHFNFSDTATAADISHPIFNGPFTPVGTTWTGDSFGHAILTGGGTTPLINGSAPGVVLAELHPGAGLALFGGMTTTNFHEPQPQATNLRWNILYYTAFASLCDTDPPVITVPKTIDVIAQTKKVNKQFGAFVSFSVSAVDPEDGPVPAIATPPSGSFFPVGLTTVTVTATDSCGNTSTSYFAVTVAKKKKRHGPL